MQQAGIQRDSLTTYNNSNAAYRLQTDDVLSIVVKSQDPKNAALFNLEENRAAVNVSPGSTYLAGYSVNTKGDIRIPIVGVIHVADLSISEAQELLQTRIDSFLKDATVLVNLVSFKVSVLGEVRNPGQFYCYNNRLNILEAISRAGDLLDFANRTKVYLFRQSPKGSVATRIDLTDGDLVNSPFFYLKPNDVLYVEPLEQKSTRLNLANLQVLTALFSGISTLATIVVLLRNR